jgi:hypothetical protein
MEPLSSSNRELRIRSSIEQFPGRLASSGRSAVCFDLFRRASGDDVHRRPADLEGELAPGIEPRRKEGSTWVVMVWPPRRAR